MQHDRFVGLVQHRAALPSRGHAEAAIRATLMTLGERLLKSAADHLASQLPHEIALHLTGAAIYDKMSLDEFYERIAIREACGLTDAKLHAAVVLGLIAEVVSAGLLEKLRGELPEEFRELLVPEPYVWPDFVGVVREQREGP